MYNKKAVFIVNPVAGGSDKKPIIDIINKKLAPDIDREFIFWHFPKQKDDIVARIKEDNFDYAIAVGGDGTINEVASALVGTSKALGIIPVGSGNGLARHLRIPLKAEDAVNVINNKQVTAIDAALVNDKYFFCTSGVGFDALIGNLFATSSKRGFYTYFKLTLNEFLNYKPQHYTLYVDGEKHESDAFLITVANASQYGNNAYIAPQADITDGQLDVCVLRPFKWYEALPLGIRMFNRTIEQSPVLQTYKGNHIVIERNQDEVIHYDGEPKHMSAKLKYEVIPGALQVLIP